MDLIIAIIVIVLLVMWAYSMFNFHSKMMYFNSIVKYYEMKCLMDPNDVTASLGLASAYMQTQKYQKAYRIYEQLCANGLENTVDYGESIRINMEFCRQPLPGCKGPKDYKNSWRHNFMLVRFGGRRKLHFAADDMFEADSLIRQRKI